MMKLLANVSTYIYILSFDEQAMGEGGSLRCGSYFVNRQKVNLHRRWLV